MSTKRTIQMRIADEREKIALPELFDAVVKLKKDEEVDALLQAYYNADQYHRSLLQDCVQCLYHPDVIMELPEGEPPYKSEYIDYNMAPGSLHKTFTRVKYFVRGHSNFIINKIKREQIYIQQLEAMFKPDADLFIMIKDKRLTGKYKSLTEDVFRRALPSVGLPDKADSK